MELMYISPVLIAVLCSLYYYFTRTFNYWKDRGIVGPQPIPLFGNVIKAALRYETHGEPIANLYHQYPNEKVVGMFRMTEPYLLIKDLDIIKQILIKDFDKFSDRGVELSEEGLGTNLFHADTETWSVLRSRFTPLFTSGKLKNMIHLMTERGDKFIKYVESITENQAEHQIHSLVQKYTISTIAACAFGMDIDDISDNNPMIKILNRIDREVFSINFAFEIILMYPRLLKKLNLSVFPKYVTNFFYKLTNSIISERKGKPTERRDFMDLILELKEQKEIQSTKKFENDIQMHLEISESIIAAQSFAFYAGGYETSATTMTFLLYLLAMNPHVQEKLHQEIDKTYEIHNGELSYEIIKSMTYLHQVFDETLRLFPIVEPLQRRAKNDYKIPGTDIVIEKDKIVLISLRGIHHDPKYYPNPEVFDPERFNAKNSAARHPCAYMPFGVGPRNCIGLRFAKLQSSICIIKFLSKFRVEPSENTLKEMKFDPKRVVMSPSDGILINILPRKYICNNYWF
ncbi:cytochrome P450 6B2-like [Galleria mellonella]|uniref:unspecific monooxygenase n=1 Tax=Galleria mellonella TaxID=7137 RepID=A0A6J1X2I4_GALME|nr:cytochrome P450 6B2-like [Galleria mellonella]